MASNLDWLSQQKLCPAFESVTKERRKNDVFQLSGNWLCVKKFHYTLNCSQLIAQIRKIPLGQLHKTTAL